MSVIVQSDDSAIGSTTGVFSPKWLRGAAVVRIFFGLIWAFDAAFKWLPGFISGQTLPDELGNAENVDVPRSLRSSRPWLPWD